jgi:hypothetical protein
VPPKRRLRKIIDDEALVSCESGPGLIREEAWEEEAWEDEAGAVVRYNLAFINHFLTAKDHGRVLGYDNAHGEHHRHFCGEVEMVAKEEYDVLVARFLDEVSVLRKRKEIR